MQVSLAQSEKFKPFVRSLLPEQPEQIVLLLGSALLLTAFRLASWHDWGRALALTHGSAAYITFGLLTGFTLVLVYAGGAAGLHLCLFPKANPFAWLKRFVYLPVIAGWALNIGVRYYFGYRYPDVQAEYARMVWVERIQRDSFFASVGLSFWVIAVALACIWLAGWSIRSGEMKLPVAFCGGRGATTDFQTRKFAWLMVVLTMPVTSIALIVSFAVANPALMGSAHPVLAQFLTEIVMAASFVALLLIAVKADAASLFRASLKLPPVPMVALGVVFPLMITSIPGLVKFAMARMAWAQVGYGHIEPPIFETFFGQFRWTFLLMIIPALAEEIAWRGYLQPRLISRYGLYRGIFFVGIVWGAFHFASDFSATTTWIHFVPGIAGRLIYCVTLGFVLSWLTLRSGGSVIPAGISHGLVNALVMSPWTVDSAGWWLYPGWVVLAAVLYRYWPPGVAPNEAAGESGDEFRDVPDVEAGTA
jgi:membrane protease YdiL (CAAX protease family)